MANPTPYTKAFNFAGYQAMNPVLPAPGSRLDTEFSNVATSIASLRSSVMNVRREDGKLVNGIVTMDALSTEVKIALTTSDGDLTAIEGYVDERVAEQVSASTETLEAYVDTQTLVNQATYVRTAAQWLEKVGIMAGPTPSDLAIALAEGAATGRRIMIPEGTYSITSQITFTSALDKNLRLELHRNANIILASTLTGTDGCFLKVNNAAGKVVEIEGGEVNGGLQPKPEPGQSWAGISLSNVGGGGIFNTRFIAGGSWLSDKSDSAVFVQGTGFTIRRCWFQGWSDAAIYTSGDGNGFNTYGLNAIDNDFFQCAAAFLSKRVGVGSIFALNRVRKCANGAATGEAVSGATLLAGGNKLLVNDNQFDECISPIYLENADNSVVSGNSIRGFALNLDGTPFAGTRAAIRLLGTKKTKVCDNSVEFLGSGVDAAGILLQPKTLSGVTRQSTNNTISDNDLNAGSGAGGGVAMYETTGGDHNYWLENRLQGTWATDYITSGANSVQHYWDAAGTRHTVFDEHEVMAINRDGVRIVPSDSTGRFTIERAGVPEARLEQFSDAGGHHFRARSAPTAAKRTLHESRTFGDTPVTGGGLGHLFTVGATEVFELGAEEFFTALAILPEYANEAAAISGGLRNGAWFRTGTSPQVVVNAP